MNNQNKISDEEKLKNFLLDISCLDSLSMWINPFNVFEFFKISSNEPAHSNVLAWLMNPTGNHGLGDAFLSEFIKLCVRVKAISENKILDALIMDYSKFRIEREKIVRDKGKNGFIDIFAESVKSKFVLCIENKIDSKERDGQLDIYKNAIKTSYKYKGYTYAFLFLTRYGDTASDPTNWKSISYYDVLDILDKVMETHGSKINTEQKVFIENYIETLRRKIVRDEELDIACAKIYEKHKGAIDLLFHYRERRAKLLSKKFREWAEKWAMDKKIMVGHAKSHESKKIYVRFTTSKMSEVIKKDGIIASWGTDDHYFYELEVNENELKFWMQLAICEENLGNNQNNADRIKNYYLNHSREGTKVVDWMIYMKTSEFEIDETMDEKTCCEHLNQLFEEIKSDETELLDYLDK